MLDPTGTLRSAGLMPHQADFVTQFLAADAPRYQLLTAPTGLGKTRLVAWLVRQLVGLGGGRALLIAPRFLVEQLAAICREEAPSVRVQILTKRVLRELVASVEVGDSPWPNGAVFIGSFEVVSESEARAAILAAEWSLLVVDEAHQLTRSSGSVVKDLVTYGKAGRVLFLSGSNDWKARVPWIGTEFSETSWSYNIVDWDGQPLLLPTLRRRLLVDYKRDEDERTCLTKLFAVLTRTAESPAWEFPASTIVSAASSSTSALEQMLLQRRNRLAHDPEPVWTDPDLIEDVSLESKAPGAWSDLETITQLIECLDSVKTDAKAGALLSLLASLGTADGIRVCVFTQFVATADYLAEALQEAGFPVLLSWGGLALEDRKALTARLERKGGVFITTEAASPGLELAGVSVGVNYDLPRTSALMDQRWGRLSRLGAHRQITMYALRDLSATIEAENTLLRQFGFVPEN